MRKQRIPARLVCFALTAALLCAAACAFSESWDQIYVENEWNFADGAMDISGGIPENATGVMDRIRRNGKLRVATEPFFAPFEFTDPEKEGQEQYAGADMMLARLIAERMGVELEIIPLEFTQVMPALMENQCDLTISAIAFTPGRAASYALAELVSPEELSATYILPAAFDKRVGPAVAAAVARAARESGVARI